jgi:hypothetical protein
MEAAVDPIFDEKATDEDGAGTDGGAQDATVADLFGDEEAPEEDSAPEADAAER